MAVVKVASADIIDNRISVNSMCSATWTWQQDLEFYRDAGFCRVGLSFEKLLNEAGGEMARMADVARAVRDQGLEITNLLGLGVFDLKDPHTWAAHQERLAVAIEVASIVEAQCLILLTGPAGPMTWESAADALEVASRPFLEKARDVGVPVALEHTNSLRMDISFLHTLADTVMLARRLGCAVCMDISACWIERGLKDTITDAHDILALVQIADCVVGSRSTPNRCVLGEGGVPLHRIIGDVLGAGYNGYFDLEILGPHAEITGYAEVITRSSAWLTAALSECTS